MKSLILSKTPKGNMLFSQFLSEYSTQEFEHSLYPIMFDGYYMPCSLHDSELGLRINAGPNINLFIRGLVPSDIRSVHPCVAKLAVLFSSGYKYHISVSYLS